MDANKRDAAYLAMLLDGYAYQQFAAGVAHGAGLMPAEDAARNRAKALRLEIDEILAALAQK